VRRIDMKGKKILVGGILAGIVIEVISLSFSWLTQWIWKYDMLELGGMRTTDDPLMVFFFIHPWVLGFALAFVYSHFEKSIKGDYFHKGAIFGLLMWIVIAIPNAVIVFSSMDYPIGFTVNQVIGPLIYLFVTSVVIAKTFEWIK
jgi:hypothetical protein